MGLSIHFNAQDLRNIKRFTKASTSLARTLSNLSSGVRTRASEIDGATLKISQRFSSELRTAKAELRNVTSNASLLQTLDSALTDATHRLHEMRELALSAASSHVSMREREQIEQRFRQLIDQVYTLSEETKYNGRTYLNGDRYELDFSLASETAQRSIKDDLGLFKLPNLDPKTLGKHVSHVGQGRGVFLGPLGSDEIEINGIKIRGTIAHDDPLSFSYRSGSAIAKAKAINASSALTGVTAKVDINVYRSFDQLKGAQLDRDRWVKINGYTISGISYLDHDATGSLREAINAGLSETGVMASLDSKGQLLLAAPDGRNITIEFSDLELREAMGVRDLYGDDVNFSPDVDPATYTHYGDISSVEYVGTDSRILGAPPGQFSGSFEVLDSRFTRPQDGVDYIFEVVKAGELGQALFRVKEEQLADNTRDVTPEDYLFSTGVEALAPPTPNKVLIDSTQYLGASQIRIGLRVIAPGSPESQVVAEQPEVEIFLTSLDDPNVAEVSLGQFKITNNQVLDLTPHGLPAVLTFPVDETRYFLDHQGLPLNQGDPIPPTFLPPDHDYDPLQPEIKSWDGIHSADIKLEVIESGHGLADRDHSFTDETPAVIRMTATLLHQNRTVVEEYTLDEHRQINLIGVGESGSEEQGSLGIIFPSSYNQQQLNTTIETSGDYNLRPRIYKERFVGEEEREYELKLTSDGILSYQIGDGGPSVEVSVFGIDDQGERVLIQSYQIDELNSDRSIYVGQGTEQDGFRLNFRNSPVLEQVTRSRDVIGDLHFSAYRYNELSNHTAVVQITQSGIDVGEGAAHYEYFYQEDPNNILGTGSLGKYTVFPDGTYMRSWAGLSRQSNVPHISSGIMFFRDFGYESSQGGSFNCDVIEGEDGLVLETTWSPDSPSEEVFQTDFLTNRFIPVGRGIRAYFYRDRIEQREINPLEIDFSGSVSPSNFYEEGDTFTYQINPQLAREGDTYTFRVTPVDLVAGAEWQFQAIGPDWKPGDTYYADLGTSFDQSIHPLTETLSYPVNDENKVLGEIKVSGQGRFEVGDQIRVGTRGFVGEVRTSGAYTSPALPTDYLLTVTKGGEVSEAELSWERADGDTDTEHGGQGILSGLTEGQDAYMEEGVYVSFHDLGHGAYLAQGDQIAISVGRNLKYTFGGQVSLHSRDHIEVTYSDANVDRQLGKVTFTGSDEEALSPRHHDLSASQATIRARDDSSLEYSGVLSQSEVLRAVETVDTALTEIDEARSSIGATLNRLERQQSVLLQKVSVFSGVSERLLNTDYAASIASLSAAQIKLMSAPQLLNISRVNSLRVLDLINQPSLLR